MDDDFFAQQRASEALHNANMARQLATEAAHQAAMATIEAQRTREAAERSAADTRAMEAHMAREQAATNQTVANAALVQEAVAAIPFLRTELTQRFGQRPALRDFATSWLRSGAGTAEQQALLDAALCGSAADAAGWLALALAYSQARANGDADAAQRWRQAAVQAAPLPASAWIFLDGLRRGEAPDADSFAALAQAAESAMHLNRAMYRIISFAGEGHFGPACQARMEAMLRSWLAQQQNDSRALLNLMLEQPTALPAGLAALEQIDHVQLGGFYRRVLSAWRGLKRIDDALDKPVQVLAPQPFPDFAQSGMMELALLPDGDELRLATRLAFYLAAIDGRGDADAAMLAERKARQKHAGDWWDRASLIAALADYRQRPTVLAALRPALLERTRAVMIDDVGAPPLQEYGTEYPSWHAYQLRRLEAARRQELRASGQLASVERDAERRARARRRKTMFKAALVWGIPASLVGMFFVLNPLNPLAWLRRTFWFYSYQYPLVDDFLFFGGLAAWLAGRKARRHAAPLLDPIVPTDEQVREWDAVESARAIVPGMLQELQRMHARIHERLGMA